MSRQELADAANQILGTSDLRAVLTENDVGKIERGIVSWPHAERRAALRTVLQVATDLELGFANRRRRPTDQISLDDADLAEAPPASTLIASRASAAMPRLMPSGTGFLNDGLQLRPVELRPAVGYMPFLPAALDRPTLDWLVGVTTADRSWSGRGVADAAEVTAAAQRLDELRSLDHQFGAGTVYPHVTEFLRTRVHGLLAAGPGSDPWMQQQVLEVALGGYELAGYQAVDIGADGLAQQHYLRALSLTRTNRAYGAYLVAVSLGHLALHCGYPQQALRMAQAAIMGSAASITPLVSSALHAVLARAYARMGDDKASSEALGTAQSAESRSSADDEPAWVRYLTPAYLADEAAHCLFDLGHYEEAELEVVQAMAGIGKTRFRRLAIDGALLASSLIRAGRLDEGCARAREAADLARRTTSQRTVQRVAQLRAELSPFDGQPDVVACLEYLHETLPAAG